MEDQTDFQFRAVFVAKTLVIQLVMNDEYQVTCDEFRDES